MLTYREMIHRFADDRRAAAAPHRVRAGAHALPREPVGRASSPRCRPASPSRSSAACCTRWSAPSTTSTTSSGRRPAARCPSTGPWPTPSPATHVDPRPEPGTVDPAHDHRRRPRVGRRPRERRVVSRDRPMNPVAELRAFVRAALVDPVPRDHTEPDWAFRRRRVVVAVTLLVGRRGPGLGAAHRARRPDVLRRDLRARRACGPAGPSLSGPLHLGRGHTRDGHGSSRAVVQSLALGALLLGAVHARCGRRGADPGPARPGAGAARPRPVRLPRPRHRHHRRQRHRRGALLPRGACTPASVAGTPWRSPRVVYTLVTATSGIPLLVLAAALVGLVVAFQRRVTGGILGPTITHLTWSLGMLFLLPPVLDRLSLRRRA